MDAFQVMSRMMQQDPNNNDPNLYRLSVSLAERLAFISDRLDEEELNQFIDMAAAVYRRGLNEGREAEPVKDSFPGRDTWPNDYNPRSAAYA